MDRIGWAIEPCIAQDHVSALNTSGHSAVVGWRRDILAADPIIDGHALARLHNAGRGGALRLALKIKIVRSSGANTTALCRGAERLRDTRARSSTGNITPVTRAGLSVARRPGADRTLMPFAHHSEGITMIAC
jgi:hypothetical protein